MCKYQRINPENPVQMPLCVATGGLCTYCIFGNAKIYNEAEEKEEKEGKNYDI